MNRIGRSLTMVALALAGAAAVFAQEQRKPASPAGHSATQVGGKWVEEKNGESRYEGGHWIEVDYSRPILRGRANIFGSGAEYGKKVNAGAPVWRAGANKTTQLHTEVPLLFGEKRVEPGTYDVFVDLKEGSWTLILSTQPAADKYDPKDKSKMWGSYGYDSKYDVARLPMTLSTPPHSVDQFTIAFLDMTDDGGKLAMAWDHQAAMVDFRVAR